MKLLISGIKYPDNIKQIAELSPYCLGFVFHEGSRRFVGEDFIIPEIQPGVSKSGIFVNSPLSYVLDKVKKHKLDYVQLHGNESPEYCEQISKMTAVIKAFGIDENFDPQILNSYKHYCTFFLFDYTADYEGSGKLNWEAIKRYDNSVPYFISGGMDHEKLRLLKTLNLNVSGIEINSKFEIKPGYKDIIKIIRFKNLLV